MDASKPQTLQMHKFVNGRLALLNSHSTYPALEYALEECGIVSTFDIVIREKADPDKKIVLLHRIPLYSAKNAVILLSKFAVIEGLINDDTD